MAISTKDKILDAAVSAFSDVGVNGTSTRAICERAGVNGAALNYHWGSKNALWLAACQWAGRTVLDAVTRRFAPGNPVAETIRQVVGDTFDAFAEDERPLRIIAWASLQADHVDFGLSSEQFQPVVQFGKDYLERRAATGEIAAIDHEAALASYWGMVLVTFIDRPGHRVFFGKDTSDPEHAARMRASLIRSALAILGVADR